MTSAIIRGISTTNSEGTVFLFHHDRYSDITPLPTNRFLYENDADVGGSSAIRNYFEVLEENRELKRQLEELQQDVVLSTAAAQLSESSLGEIWNNPEDAAYDDL